MNMWKKYSNMLKILLKDLILLTLLENLCNQNKETNKLCNKLSPQLISQMKIKSGSNLKAFKNKKDKNS